MATLLATLRPRTADVARRRLALPADCLERSDLHRRDPLASPGNRVKRWPDGLLVVGGSGCHRAADGRIEPAAGVSILVASASDGGDAALIVGEVRLVDGCLAIDDAVALWPAGTEVARETPLKIRVPGLGLVEVGSTVRGSGGVVQPGGHRGDPPLSDTCADAAVVTFRPG